MPSSPQTATPNDMPPQQFAMTNGIRMGYFDAGPHGALPPVVLCHGWPEIAYSWRHQIRALAAAGIRVIAPDQRGFGATDRPAAVEAYDLEQLTADLVGLLGHLRLPQAVFVGHDWGGFVVWQMALRHPERVVGVAALNTPHTARPPVDPIAILRKRHGDAMYIVQFQGDARDVDAVFDSHVEQVFDCFMRKPLPASGLAGGAARAVNSLAFPQIVAAYDAGQDPRKPILTADERQVFVDTFQRTGFTGGINWYRNMTRNWERSAGLDTTVRVPALMVMAENDAVLPPSAADGMAALIPDLEKVLIPDCGHWTQQEQPAEVNRLLIDWYRRRFG
jgi:microsomal epoxide hydrolase/non-specific protein-tyrosine kinase